MEQFSKRGEYKNENYAKQLNSFEGLLRRRGITPTDIDGLIDYNGKAFVILEGKHGDARIPMGQRMALENIANAMQDGGRQVIVLVFRHYVKMPDTIIVSTQEVTEYYINKQWHNVGENMDVLDAIIKFEDYCQKKGIIL